MKNVVVLLLACLGVLTACQKEVPENPGAGPDKKILGKWISFRYYESMVAGNGTLLSEYTEDAQPGDSVVFKANGKVHVYSDTDPEEVQDYSFTAPNRIRIENEEWRITVLNDSDLHLEIEETDPVTGVKDRARVELKR